MGIQAGKLDRKIEIQELSETTTPSGAKTATWYTIETVWAAVTPVSGREPFAAQQRYAEVDTVFSIRYRKDVGLTPLHRILFDGRYYGIVEVIPVPAGRPDHLEVRATARAE